MICEACHGTGRWTKHVEREHPEYGVVSWDYELFCNSCHGTGIMHCCDGICVQPDGDDNG
jgi:hypothetical protein